MPGTFAHMTFVNAVRSESLEAIPGLDGETREAIGLFLNFCELGSVSPDYPSLTVFDKGAACWANVMHYYATADFVRDCIRHLTEHPPADPLDRQRCIAWLFGYAAHLVADLAVHPVIAERVGCYEGHEALHRRCELHQDVYIFDRIMGEDVCSAEYLRRAGIMTCAENGALNPAVASLWSSVLNVIPRADLELKLGPKSPTKDPDPNLWHKWFTGLIDNVAEEGRRLPALVRRLGEDELYPQLQDVDPTFIDDLKTPSGERTSYLAIVDRVRENIIRYWGELGTAVQEKNPRLFTLPNADLDTGVAESAPLFWRNA